LFGSIELKKRIRGNDQRNGDSNAQYYPVANIFCRHTQIPIHGHAFEPLADWLLNPLAK
jgi:hypothetical protein